MSNPDTIIKDWYVVDLVAEEGVQGTVLWGIVHDDPSGRWRPGEWCCSSKVASVGDDTVKTRNSTYGLHGQGERVQMPLNALLALRSGYGPSDYELYKTLQAAQKQEEG